LTTDYYLSYDLVNEEIMFTKNADELISPASLTKLMTALLIVDSYNLGDFIEINFPEEYVYEGKVAYLESGQQMTVESLLEFILIYSANDACIAASMIVSGDVDKFINLMNNKAVKLGMNNTNFNNPDGLDADNHFTSLNDLLILSKEVLKNIELLTIIMKPSFISDIEGNDKVYLNTNKLIEKNYMGLKTGWTNEAGLTFIGVNLSNNREILTIVNKSTVNESKDNHFSDTEILYKLSIDTFVNNVLLEDDIEAYIIRNAFNTSTIKTVTSWTVFGNKYAENNLYLNNINTKKLEFKVNENVHSIKITDSLDKKIWNFNFTNFLTLNANQNNE
jgi:D-alanyl-D-alanine carboxypeptidase (penicillin-binding protein 5/6)